MKPDSHSKGINQLVESLSGLLDLDQICRQIATAALDLTRSDLADVVLVDRSLNALTVRASVGLSRLSNVRSFPIADRVGIVGFVRQTGRSLRIDDIQRTDRDWSPWYLPLMGDIRSELCVPIVLEGETRVLGVIDCESREENHYSADHEQSIVHTARRVAGPIRAAQTYDRLLALASLARSLADPASLEGSLGYLLKFALEQTGAESGSIRRLDDSGQQLVPVVRRGEMTHKSYEPVPVGQGVIGRVFQTGRYLLIRDVHTLSETQYLNFNTQTRSELAVCITYEGGPLGVLNLEHHEVGSFDIDDADFIGNLAGYGAMLLTADERKRDEVRRGQQSVMVDIGRLLAHRVSASLVTIASLVGYVIDHPGGIDPQLIQNLQRVHQLADTQEQRFRRILMALKFRMAPDDLDDIARVSYDEMLRSSLSEPRIDFEFQSSGHTLGVYVDREALVCMIEDLITNSIESISAGRQSGGRIVVQADAYDGWAEVVVTDNGPGIPDDVASQLFETTGSTKADDDRHRGISLFLARRLCELMGGYISLVKTSSLGTSIALRMPLKPVA